MLDLPDEEDACRSACPDALASAAVNLPKVPPGVPPIKFEVKWLSDVPSRRSVLVNWVPPAEVDALRQRLKLEGLAIAVDADEQLQSGQARLNSPAGSVELGLEAQLQNLRRSLLPFAEEGVA